MAVGTYLACDTDINSVLKISPQELVGKTGAGVGGWGLISVTSATEKYAIVGKDLSVRSIKKPAVSGSPFHNDSLF